MIFFLLFDYPSSQSLYIWLQLMVISVTHLFKYSLNKWLNKHVLQSVRGTWNGDAKSHGTGHAHPQVLSTGLADWQVNIIRMHFCKHFVKSYGLSVIGTQGKGIYMIQSWEGEVMKSFMEEMRLGWILRKHSFNKYLLAWIKKGMIHLGMGFICQQWTR